MQEKMFEMFYRGSERSIGNGLGLFMVKKAFEILNGSIAIASEPNVLTTFTVTIPAKSWKRQFAVSNRTERDNSRPVQKPSYMLHILLITSHGISQR